MSYIPGLSGKKSKTIDNFLGVNRAVSPFDIKDGECTDMMGLSSEGYPQLSTAKTPGDEEFFMEAAKEQEKFFLKKIDNNLMAICAGVRTHIYDTENKGFKHYYESRDDYLSQKKVYTIVGRENTMQTGYRKDVIKFNDCILSTDYVGDSFGTRLVCTSIACDDIQKEIWGSQIDNYKENKLYLRLSVRNLDTTIPATYFAVNAFRVYAVSDDHSKMYYCAQNQPYNWTREGDAGSFEVTTYDGENGSGIAAFSGAIIYFKNHSMHEFYGNTAANGRLVTISGSLGCMSHHSIVNIGGRLYWLGDNAIYTYDGGKIPTDISEPIKKYLADIGEYIDCFATTDSRRYILSLSLKDGSNILLAYDTFLGTWHIMGNHKIRAITALNTKIYGIIENEDKKRVAVHGIFENDDTGEWHWKSKCFTAERRGQKQNFHSIGIIVEKPENSEVIISITNNRGQKCEKHYEAKRLYGVGDKTVTEKVKILLPGNVAFGAEWLEIEIRGRGKCKIHSVTAEYRERRGSW